MAATRDPRDPRFLRYRAAMWGVYILISATFAGAVINGVVRSVWRMSPPPLPPSDTTLTVRECIDEADGLFRDLDHQRQELTAREPVRAGDSAWYQFRVDWLERYRQAQAKCATQSRSRQPLQAVFERLEYLMDLYTTSAIQFDGQVGPAVDGVRQAIARARQDPAAGRF